MEDFDFNDDPTDPFKDLEELSPRPEPLESFRLDELEKKVSVLATFVKKLAHEVRRGRQSGEPPVGNINAFRPVAKKAPPDSRTIIRKILNRKLFDLITRKIQETHSMRSNVERAKEVVASLADSKEYNAALNEAVSIYGVSKLTATGAFREYVTTRIKNLKQLHKDTPSALSPNPELRSNSSSRSGRDSVSSVISPGGSLSDCRPADTSRVPSCSPGDLEMASRATPGQTSAASSPRAPDASLSNAPPADSVSPSKSVDGDAKGEAFSASPSKAVDETVKSFDSSFPDPVGTGDLAARLQKVQQNSVKKRSVEKPTERQPKKAKSKAADASESSLLDAALTQGELDHIESTVKSWTVQDLQQFVSGSKFPKPTNAEEFRQASLTIALAYLQDKIRKKSCDPEIIRRPAFPPHLTAIPGIILDALASYGVCGVGFEEIARRVRRFVTALLVTHCVVENDLDALAPLSAHNSELSKAFHSSHEDKLEQCLRIVSSLPTTIPLLELMNIAVPLALRRLKITWNDSPLELIERLQSEYKIKAAAKGLKRDPSMIFFATIAAIHLTSLKKFPITRLHPICAALAEKFVDVMVSDVLQLHNDDVVSIFATSSKNRRDLHHKLAKSFPLVFRQ
jgi:hypothetical protein